eukprot:2951323-Rhodomonas_salina.1
MTHRPPLRAADFARMKSQAETPFAMLVPNPGAISRRSLSTNLAFGATSLAPPKGFHSLRQTDMLRNCYAISGPSTEYAGPRSWVESLGSKEQGEGRGWKV